VVEGLQAGAEIEIINSGAFTEYKEIGKGRENAEDSPARTAVYFLKVSMKGYRELTSSTGNATV